MRQSEELGQTETVWNMSKNTIPDIQEKNRTP